MTCEMVPSRRWGEPDLEPDCQTPSGAIPGEQWVCPRCSARWLATDDVAWGVEGDLPEGSIEWQWLEGER